MSAKGLANMQQVPYAWNLLPPGMVRDMRKMLSIDISIHSLEVTGTLKETNGTYVLRMTKVSSHISRKTMMS